MNPSPPHRSGRRSTPHPLLLRRLLHYIYGAEPQCSLEGVTVKYSKTGKPRYVLMNGKRLFTIKPNDMSVTLSPEGAAFLEGCFPPKVARVYVSEVPEKTVFAKHVIDADEGIRRGVDVLIIYESRLVAFGKALMSGREMKELNLGEAARVRGKVP
ncbi:PUA domain containing protein [Ignicoccus hospitalis KIN4/I]|uniref:PUA domain containing protein n=1 Tax=Ignicoccus hospitalis (strain KIN4/I / DSM 18386 / JCM 14125) TaxID=453591 RepID=A8ABN7_IGNH4|nr:PUA domain containing protein [Ignicoccus hospitalis KIN4/I]